eukprot:TRINITY_DN3816_c1_g1_i3.p1 TRINITY_DN3816_c1_g1~~TRINITY_DN3816_c1_g1_i3.p1  ORF type:complete len:478 (+),score=54.79 TRINITY_DN3816_c1_g1_i3:379-1812(+)
MSGGAFEVVREVLQKILSDHSLAFKDMLSWHVACPRLITRSMVAAAGVQLCAPLLHLDTTSLLEKYSDEEDVPRPFVRYLTALAESQESQSHAFAVAGWGAVALLSVGKVAIYGIFHSIVTPRTVPFPCRIVKVVAGEDHGLMLADSGEAFTFGRNGFGACGQMTGSFISLPSRVKALDDVTIADIAAGPRSSAFIDVHGKVYACGWTSSNRSYFSQFPSWFRDHNGGVLDLPPSPLTSVPMEEGDRILKFQVEGRLWVLLLKWEQGVRELYSEGFATMLECSRRRPPAVSHMRLIIGGAGPHAPIAVCQDMSDFNLCLVLLFGGSIVRRYLSASPAVIAPEEEEEDWSCCALEDGERVVGIATAGVHDSKGLVLLLGDRGTVGYFSVEWSERVKLKRFSAWSLPVLAPGDKAVSITADGAWRTIITTRDQKVFWVGNLEVPHPMPWLQWDECQDYRLGSGASLALVEVVQFWKDVD